MSNPEKNVVSGKLLLISMPFASPCTPSIQLGTLGSYLREKGITVDVHHAYIRCADIVGCEAYFLITDNVFNEPFYTSFLFPDHFAGQRRKIKRYYEDLMRNHKRLKSIRFETVLDKLGEFNRELLSKLDFSAYSLIGFSITYDQLRPSVYMAREIKKRHPKIPIVFGGGRCADELGVSILKTFSDVDFVVSGEGEETLTSLIMNLQKNKYDDIKGLVWRDGNSVRFNGHPDKLSIDDLPVPNYDDFFTKMENCSRDSKEFLRSYVSIPVEGSRGCWWNKCTFCNLNMQYSGYREKNVDNIIKEVDSQVKRYQCHSIRFMDNVERIRNFSNLMKGLKSLELNLNIFLEVRAGSTKKEDYRLMRDAGVKFVEIGVEAFGNKMLKKMNKGVTAIQNIASLKYCKEFGILPYYNIIINYPNETDNDLKETAENVDFLKHLVPPGSVHDMTLCHSSPVYKSLNEFNIKQQEIPKDLLLLFPGNVWQTLVPYYFDYIAAHKNKDRTSAWHNIFRPWMWVGEKLMSSHFLYYQDAGDFLTVTDRLSTGPSKKILSGIEREVYLFCDSIRSRSEIQAAFPGLLVGNMDEMLEKWVGKRWMFKEEDKFLSLAVRLSPMSSPLTYYSDMYPFSDEYLNRWRLPKPRWNAGLKLGSVANIDFSITFKAIPTWLRRLKRMLIS